MKEQVESMDDRKNSNLPTHELWAKLFQSPTVDAFLTGYGDVMELPTFSDYISGLCKARGETPERIIQRGQLGRSMGHHLFRGTRKPSRDTVLQLAFGFELTTEGAQELLKIAHMSPLHPKVKRDAVIVLCLFHGMNIIDTNNILYENVLPVLGGTRE